MFASSTTFLNLTFIWKNATEKRQHEQRRRVRLLQVRKLSSDAAAKVRQRIRQQQEQEVERIGQEELQKVSRRLIIEQSVSMVEHLTSGLIDLDQIHSQQNFLQA